ncbi:hypothetical protein [Anaerovibrio slackiae]|uniref:hypothetical protein n=1 Tax=Anaerovibrio slackiae TaxID=2652309 RepID=UPI0038648010
MGRFARLRGCFRTLGQYWHTDKGRHDICDYAKAFVLMLLSAAIAAAAVFFEELGIFAP